LANRIAARFATKIGLASELSLEELSPQLKEKAVVVGNPLRPVIWNGDKKKAKSWANFDARDDALPTLYVTGGSQGARVINRAVEAALPELLTFCRIIHQCGQQPANDEQDYDRLAHVSTQLSPELRRRYHFKRFVADEINDVFALADLILGRAGAGTVNEVNALGKPAIYVPLVPTRGDEQTRNAQVSVDAGAAVIVPQSDLSSPEEAGKRLLREVQSLLSDRNRLQQMGEAARRLAKLHAAEEMAQLVVELAEKSSRFKVQGSR
jgi:UDP-N-acetylglucosamine--N-acetylmuramyl-(pentapeptide) pyrophosphoryl-undecaprenol N-acetylglucosamine transferase